MARDSATTERLRALVLQIKGRTADGTIHWERQLNSAHRYARWNNNLLILGPDAPLDDEDTPRYLFITPFDSTDCIEIGSDDAELGAEVFALVREVETATAKEPPTDPFSITGELLNRLTN
ncbi:MAG: hypothetical protein WCB68_18400 [Pyrinomonadaceae bacterium]